MYLHIFLSLFASLTLTSPAWSQSPSPPECYDDLYFRYDLVLPRPPDTLWIFDATPDGNLVYRYLYAKNQLEWITIFDFASDADKTRWGYRRSMFSDAAEYKPRIFHVPVGERLWNLARDRKEILEHAKIQSLLPKRATDANQDGGYSE